MQNKRGELVPIGEVFDGLDDGTVKKALQPPPQGSPSLHPP